ncbi:uncharacterized protein SPAPADRAFT_148912 [Spathaspora passalidarum NRRL Y-27907]|uniref:Vacuolar fusion protein MON1 n=1 Tax=Spathaspora passalidarum (strain NRRL Y-27907 / 11-Y1) TaxID=619300 RepID=G3AHW1_SPAPN|nr:uncharacterized protein SPAPADRAFT_148912 [Spathaspora passalidarum NRRL Y-27907]EGW34275.1 hypothetical protein SPAPADRAFT_148912 [Spathaspora passalidarum NRRL Y-27907]
MSNGFRARLGSISTIQSARSLFPTTTVEPTTAVTFTNVEPNLIGTESTYTPSVTDSEGFLANSGLLTDDEVSDYFQQPDEDLSEMLTDLIRHTPEEPTSAKQSFLDVNIFPNPYDLDEEEFYKRHIEISKEDELFHDKLKQFFILSNAGKPIYSMNGSDEIIIGYMGVITTIISTFEENMNEEIYSISVGDMKIVALNKSPLILVSISKIAHEQPNVLLSQLNMLYNYLLSIISKPTIDRNFHNKLNYDLRRILTQLDFHNLDCLCMKMTYGLTSYDSFNYYISQLLNASLQQIKISYTARQRLNKILLDSKRMRQNSDDKETDLGADLLFSILSVNSKIVSFMKPKNHNLTNQDLTLLFSIINSSKSDISNDETSEDMWFPICMPNFNPNGFLYVFVKTIILQTTPVTITLLSSNKNSFYQIRQISNYIIHKLTKPKMLSKLTKELHESNTLAILREVPISHFIYKNKALNQFVMSDTDNSVNSVLQLSYFYNTLYHTKASQMKTIGSLNIKKFSYTRWTVDEAVITGFMLSDNNYEFYCLCNYQINSKELIGHCIKVIKWCEKNYNRLFIGNGVSFT